LNARNQAESTLLLAWSLPSATTGCNESGLWLRRGREVSGPAIKNYRDQTDGCRRTCQAMPGSTHLIAIEIANQNGVDILSVMFYSAFERSMSSGLTREWIPVRMKKTRQIKIIEPCF
jgi:hypothetical protein